MTDSNITKALHYIDEFLDTELTLDKVARAAHTSSFHFHRIFKAAIGETLNGYITRRRIEKAAAVLMRKPEVAISELALQFGFNSNSSFTRSFKKYYGVNPSTFRKESPSRYSKIGQAKSKNGQDFPLFEQYICDINNQMKWIDMNTNIEVKDLPEMNVAYLDSIGVQNLSGTYVELIKWATPRGLMTEEAKLGTIYHDSFKITASDKVRMSACILLDNSVEKDDVISVKSIQGGSHIVAHIEIGVHEFPTAWSNLFVWMNENGYKKSANDSFEIYYNDFNQHPKKMCTVDLCIPIE